MKNQLIIAGCILGCLVCLADPFILFHYSSGFPGYSQFSELISELGSSNSPVTKLFSAWWVISGLFFIAYAGAFYYSFAEQHGKTAVLATWLLVLFAVGDCIVSGIFPDDHFNGGEVTFASRVHVGIGAVGIFALLAFPIVMRKIITDEENRAFYGFSLLVFCIGMLMAVLLFFRYVYVPYLSDLQGLWQRIMMFTFYIYFIVLAAIMIKRLYKTSP